MDDTWLADVCYADDIILLSCSLNDLVAMLEEALVAFAEVGLEVGLDKTHWTSWPPMPGRHLQVAGVDIVWEPHLTLVGHIFDFTGNCCAAIHYRTAQARKAYHRWKPLLLSKWLSVKRRVALGSRAVFASLLWLAETWTVTKVQCSKMESWGARLLAQIARVRRGLTEDIGSFLAPHASDGTQVDARPELWNLISAYDTVPPFRRTHCSCIRQPRAAGYVHKMLGLVAIPSDEEQERAVRTTPQTFLPTALGDAAGGILW